MPDSPNRTPETDALFSSIGEGIIATDDNGIITKVNEAALNILGYTEDELIGTWFPKRIVATFHDGTPIGMMERPVTKAIVTGKTITERMTYKRQDGSLVPVSLTVSPIMALGKPAGAIEVFRDISHDIQSDKMKTEFISVASHQLRTPLSAINVYSRMLSDGMAGALSQQQQEFVGNILVSVERMNDLINTLLNITRIEAGGVNVRISTVNLSDVVRDLLDESRPGAEERGVNLTSDIATATIVDTDSILIREVYSNLLSNAVKYTPAGGSVAVSLKAHGNNLVFSVRDTGYGIPQSAQDHIFTKFFRADNILGEDVSGTGLGLYLTKTIAESLDGNLWFESKEGSGSLFCFELSKQGSSARHGKFKLD